MPTTPRQTRALALGGTLALVVWTLSQPAGPARGTPPPALALPAAQPSQARAATGSPWLGAGSCAASNCHGSIAAVPALRVLGNEHTTWIGDDPHARAYQVLLDPRSESIARNLAGSGAIVPAYQDQRCLACHSTPRPESIRTKTAWMDADGVSCEACHGPARDWIGPHTTAGWNEGRTARPDSFYETRDLTARARLCAECHIGERDAGDGITRDVNHDLIAAGHPRLNFEFAAYHDRMPTHWTPGVEEAAADFPARAWLIGQMTSLEKSLTLTRDRAKSADAPWPEFAEYGCFGCHHDLIDQGWRRDPADGQSTIGVYDWASWYAPAAREAVEVAGGSGPASAVHELVGRLALLMNRPLPNRIEVAHATDEAVQRLQQIEAAITGHAIDEPTIRRWITELSEPVPRDRPTAWDRAAQRYLALVPLYQAWTCMGDDSTAAERQELRARLEGLRRSLEAGPAGAPGE